MAPTTRANLIVPEVLADAVTAVLTEMRLFDGSGVVVMNDSLPGSVNGGDKVKVPYFNALGEFENPAEGAPLTPVNLTMSGDEAAVERFGRAIEMTNWAQLAASYADPYTEAANQIKDGAKRILEKRLIQKAAATTLVKDTAAGISYDALVDTIDLFGGNEDGLAFWALNPTVRTQLRKIKDTQGRPIFEDARTGGGTAYLLGIPARTHRAVSKTVDNTKYQTLLLKDRSLVVWRQQGPVVETDKDILVDSKLIAVNLYAAVHMYSKAQGDDRPGVAKLLTT